MRELSVPLSLANLQEQKQWSDMQRLLRAIKPAVQKFEPENPIRRAVFRVITSPKFDQLIMVCILLNTLTMAMEHYRMTSGYVAWISCSVRCFQPASRRHMSVSLSYVYGHRHMSMPLSNVKGAHHLCMPSPPVGGYPSLGCATSSSWLCSPWRPS